MDCVGNQLISVEFLVAIICYEIGKKHEISLKNLDKIENAEVFRDILRI